MNPNLEQLLVVLLIEAAEQAALDKERVHAHKCACGHVWRHTGASADNVQAHTCRCGKEVWERHHG